MNIRLGENIRKLRKITDTTQEKLAEYLGITAQAVSRWESGVCLPDMELLPGIASFFHTSIDELMGYHPTEEEINRTVLQISGLLQQGKRQEAIACARQALTVYPSSYALMMMLASQLTVSHIREDMEEGAALARRILRDCPGESTEGEMLRLGAKNLLLGVLPRLDGREEMAARVGTLPQITLAKEFWLTETLSGQMRINHILFSIPVVLSMLSGSLLNHGLTPEGSEKLSITAYSVEDCLADLAIWDAVYARIAPMAGENAQRNIWQYSFLHQRLAKLLADAGKITEALSHPEVVMDCLTRMKNSDSFAFNYLVRNSALAKDPLCARLDFTDHSHAWAFLHGYVENGCFSAMEGNAAFAAMVEQLRNMTE